MFISSMWDVKEPTHYSKIVGREGSWGCGCSLCCSFWVGASHRDNLMHLSPLDRNVQEIWLRTYVCTYITKVMFTPVPGAPYIKPDIFVKKTRLEVVDTFVYLGSTISRDGSLDAEINLRTQKVSTAFGKLEKRLWSDHGITIKTKISVYSTCTLTALLYPSECWTTHQRHLKQLERFHQKCLRRIMNIK